MRAIAKQSMNKQYYVYIMTNHTNRVLYTGITNNLIKRVFEHRNKFIEGFTKKYNVRKLVYYEIFRDPASAIARERLGELGFNISLKEVGQGDQRRQVYELKAEKEYKIFGFIKKKFNVQIEVDAETGKVISTKKPWWAFLTISTN